MDYKRSRSRKYDRDPLVDIDRDVLKSLAAERHLGSTALARAAKQRQQTVDHHLTGRGIGKCRRSLRVALAKALDVPEGALGGEPIPIPQIPLAQGPYEFLYSRRTRLAASRLIQEVIAAAQRDVRAADASAPTTQSRAPGGILVKMVVGFIGELIRIGEWRRRLIEWEPRALEARGYSEPPTVDAWGEEPTVPEDPAHEEAILGLIRGVGHVLRPWMEGHARLNYRSLRDLVHLPAHPFAGLNEEYSPFDPMSVVQPFAPGSAQAPVVGGGAS